MGLVRDPEAATGVDEAKRRAGREREPARRTDRRGDVLDERPGIEDVRRPERVQAEQLEVRRSPPRARPMPPGRPRPSRTCRRRRRRRGGRARAVRAPRRRRAGGPAATRPASAAIASRRASSPGDSTVTARIPAATAARELVVALARTGHDDALRRDPCPAGRDELAARRDVGAQAEPTQVGDDGESRIGLDRVGELDHRRQDGLKGPHLAFDHVEVVDIARACRTARRDRVATGRPAGPPGGSRCGSAGGRGAARWATSRLIGGRPRARRARTCPRRDP